MKKMIEDTIRICLWVMVLCLLNHWLGFEEMTLVALGYLLSVADVIKREG